MKKRDSLLKRFLVWRIKNISSSQFVLILSVLVGFSAGLAAVIIKHAVHFIRTVLQYGFIEEYHNYQLVIYPVIGIFLAILFGKFVIRKPIGHGIPNVLYSISKNNAVLPRHETFSAVVTSVLTVGFGGSAGLEGPTVSTGAAIGSNIGRIMHINYKQMTLLLGCAGAAAMAAIFKSPIAAIVFAIEVLMIDLTTFTLVPLLLANLAAVLTSYFFLGTDVVYPYQISGFVLKQQEVPFFIVFGILTGLISVYFSKVYMFFHRFFDKIKKQRNRLLLGGIALGVVIFIFPALYGEGYETINQCLAGDYYYLFNRSMFYQYKDSFIAFIIIALLIVLFKVVGASLTFGSGGVGGIFAPALFMGVNSGLVFASLANKLNLGNLNVSNYALVGMAGLISGVLHAPLTGIFLIAEITGGYQMLLPLMIVATFSYVTVRAFEANSVYTIELAKRNELITHHKDRAVLSLMKLHKLIETNFTPLSPDDTLGELANAISKSNRNLFPVVDIENNFIGLIRMDDVREIMFQNEHYETTYVKDLMVKPTYKVYIEDNMEQVAKKFNDSGKFNLVVLDGEKYLGFVSRANVFSSYRRLQCYFSAD